MRRATARLNTFRRSLPKLERRMARFPSVSFPTSSPRPFSSVIMKFDRCRGSALHVALVSCEILKSVEKSPKHLTFATGELRGSHFRKRGETLERFTQSRLMRPSQEYAERLRRASNMTSYSVERARQVDSLLLYSRKRVEA